MPPKNHYYRWLQEKREREEAEESMLTPLEYDRKTFEESYYYTTDGDPNNRWYVSGDPQKRFYVVPLVSEDGYRRSALELTIMFVLRIARCEGGYIQREDPETWLRFNAKVDKKLQGMYDYLATAKAVNIQKPDQIAERLTDIGKQMNMLRHEKAKRASNAIKYEKLITAYETCSHIRAEAEDALELNPSAESPNNPASVIMGQNPGFVSEAYVEVYRRYNFEKRKIADYDTRLQELKRQYRNLKKLEALSAHATDYIYEIYSFSDVAHQKSVVRNDTDVDSLINKARERVPGNDMSDGIKRTLNKKGDYGNAIECGLGYELRQIGHSLDLSL